MTRIFPDDYAQVSSAFDWRAYWTHIVRFRQIVRAARQRTATAFGT